MLKLKMYKTKIPSDISVMSSAICDIIRYLQETYGALCEDILFQVKVILNELILNAIKHGNKENVSKHVKVSAAVSKDGSMLLVVEDEGDGYDYACLLKSAVNQIVSVDLCDMKASGRGLLIVANLCEKVKVNKKGNRIIALKKLNRSEQ